MPRRDWVWRFADLPPERLWPVIADTNRLNEALGLPSYKLEEIPQANGTVLRRGTGKVAGMELAWEEKPYEWVTNREFRQTRVFSKGPFERFGPIFEIVPDGVGSRVTYALQWEPLTWIGRLTGRRLTEKAGTAVKRRVEEAASFLRGERPTAFDFPPPAPPPGAAERAEAMIAAAEGTGYAHGLARRLVGHIRDAMDVDLQSIRPKALARLWSVPDRHAIELCLAGVKSGMLDMRWNLLCTNCRGAKVAVPSLDQLPRGAHCASCNIEYGRDFARNVELGFAPAASLRPVASGGFCLSGPGVTPHVVVQQLLAPGERRTVSVDIAPGRYRLRTLHPGNTVEIEHEGGAFPGLRATPAGVEALPAGEAGAISFANDCGFEVALLIETREWARDALTAHEVTTLQAFRDMFSGATLRPGDEAGIGQVTILFTDLRGSTALYESIGDAPAFNLVREHFAVLGRVVRDHNGAVVKTIGDAVMAAFTDPAEATSAALAIREAVTAFDRERGVEGGLVVKLGLHMGPCIVVTLNERLDYFGGAVNMAARLQGQSTGGDIVLSRAVADDPAVRPLVAELPSRAETVVLKGFAEPVPFLRVLPISA